MNLQPAVQQTVQTSLRLQGPPHAAELLEAVDRFSKLFGPRGPRPGGDQFTLTAADPHRPGDRHLGWEDGMTLLFPDSSEDLSVAFSNAFEANVMQGKQSTKTDSWAFHEYLAHDAEDGMDVFFNSRSGLYVRVKRTGVTE